MKTYFKISLLLLLISHLNYSLAQLELPESISKNLDTINQSDITIRNIYRAYDRVPLFNSDSTINKDYIRASRWMKYVFPKLNIEDSITYSLDFFNNAYKDLLQGGFDCHGSDQANWLSDGPYDKDIVQENNDEHNGGWVDAVYGDPNNTQRILIGTKTSGIFETDNGGGTWHPLTDNLPFPVNGIRQIAPSPNNEDYLVAVTGNSIIDGSVIISWDRGNSWVPSVEGPSLNWVEYHPSIDGLLFGVSDEQVYYSIDYGSHWTQLPNPTPLGYHSTHKDIFKIRVQNDKFFIISSGLKHLGMGVYSGDEFAFMYEANFTISNSVPIVTWNQSSINNQFHDPTNSEIIFADFSNRIGSRFVIHVILNIENQVRHENDIYQTIDDGITFNLIGPDIDFGIDVQNNNKYLGWRNKNEVIISPNNPDLLYWASLLGPRKIYFSNPGYWQGISPFQGNSGHHVDYRCSHLINDNGKDRILFGNDGGIGLTPDGTQSASKIESLNGDLSINLIHAFHVHEPSKNIAYAFQDHKMLLRFGNSNLYSDGFLNEGSLAFIQDRFPTSVVGENAYFSINDAPGSLNEIVESQFANHRLNLGGDFKNYRHFPGKFARGIKFNKFNSSLNPTGGVAINIEKDISFESNILESKRIGAIGICQRDPNVLYASEFENRKQVQAINDHKLFKTTDGGVEWDNLDNSTVEIDGNTVNLRDKLIWNGIRAIVVDTENPDTLYCGIGGVYEENEVITHEKFRVIKSNDGGETFTDYSEGLPSLPIEEMLITESDNNVVFCANSIGVYYRSNNMEKWECFSKNLPNVEITDMQFDYCSNELYVSTYGRGMWKTPVPFEITSSYQKEITGVEIWNDTKTLKEDLVVKDGGVLTITGIVRVAYDKKIIIEPGGRVNLDGGILTNYCNDSWYGVEVWGDSQANQAIANQGLLLMKNGATIENAKTAIRVWKPEDWSSQGGIVIAHNSVFKNNWRSVEYISYHSFNSVGNELNNRGLFSNCEFVWDNDYENYFKKDILAAITMYDVLGVRILGCDFLDNRTYIDDFSDRPIGIYSVDAGYRVLGRNLILGQPTTHTEYNTTNYDVGQFINLKEGIRATNSNSQSSVIIDHCKFLNSRIGVHIRGVDNSVITRNLFNYTASHFNDITSMYQLGIVESTDYTVEGNHFMNEVNGASVLGSMELNTGVEQNEIYKNKYEGVYTGNYSFGKNTNDLSGTFSSSGLQWNCNDYNTYKYDEYVLCYSANQGDGNGIRLKQGTHLDPAGNEFTSGLDSQQNEFHFATNDDDNLIYYAFDSPSNTPSEVTGNIGVQLVGDPNECSSRFNTVITGVTSNILKSSTKQSLRNEFLVIDEELTEKISELDSLEAAANTANLYSMVDNLQPNNKHQVRAALEAASPYLSTELLMHVGDKTNPQYPPSWFKDLILLNVEVAQSNTFMEYLKTKDSPLPNGHYKQIDNVRNQSITERGEKLNHIIDLDTRKSGVIRLLITNELSDTTSIDWSEYNNLVTLRKDLMCRAQHADGYLGRKRVQQCDSKLDEIHNNISDYLIASTQQEMEDFYTFKKYILSISNSSGVLEGLTVNQVDELTVFSETLTGRAKVQAQNLLCFFTGNCEDLFVEYDPNTKSMTQSNSSYETEVNVDQLDHIKIVPNPNKGEFIVELKDGEEIKNMEMFGADGKRLLFDSENNQSTSTINIKAPIKGVYWIRVNTVKGDQYTTKFIIK